MHESKKKDLKIEKYTSISKTWEYRDYTNHSEWDSAQKKISLLFFIYD